MKSLSRGAVLALTAAVAIPATIAIAKSGDHGPGRWNTMTPETRQRMEDGKLAMAKTALRLTPEQEKLWGPLETQVRESFKQRAEKRAEWSKEREARREERKKAREDGQARGEGKKERQDMVERIEKMSQNMTERAEQLKSFVAVFKPFYASLSDEQKEVLRPLMRDLSPGMGRGKHKGNRWAHGGGWGPHGKHGGWDRGRDRDRDRGDSDDDKGSDATEAAPAPADGAKPDADQ